jgi:hypothetical protein
MDNAIPLRKHYGVSGKRSRRAALWMAAEKRYAGTSLALRRAPRIKDNHGIEPLCGFGLIGRRISGAGARRAARALFGDGCETSLIAAVPRRLMPRAHTAVALSLSATASKVICVRIDGEQRRNQRPTEEHHQRNGDGAAHSEPHRIACGFLRMIAAPEPECSKIASDYASFAASITCPAPSTSWPPRCSVSHCC